MKKLLNIFGAITLMGSFTSNIIACTPTRLATNEEIANRVAYLFTHESVRNANEKKITFEVDKLQSKDFYIKKLKELIPVKISDEDDKYNVDNGFHINYENFDKTKVIIYNDKNTAEHFYWLKNQINFYIQYNEFKETKKPIGITINRKLDQKDIPSRIDLGTIKSPNDIPTKDELINKIIEKSNENNFIKNWLINYDLIYKIKHITKIHAIIEFKCTLSSVEITQIDIDIILEYKMTK